MSAGMRSAFVFGSLVMAACSSESGFEPPGAAGSANGAQPGVAGSTGSAAAGTGSATGGTGSATGGTGSAMGGSSTAAAGAGGSSGGALGGNATGGTNVAGQAGSGGAAGGGGGGTSPMNKVFSECRLHFGTIDSKAKEQPGLIAELDFFTPGWMGLADTFDQKYVCDEAKEGAVLGKQVPVIVAYVAAFYAKRHHGNLCDCNVTTCGQTNGRPNDLCNFGAKYIKEDLQKMIAVYESYAKGYAECYGTKRPIVFEMEPDFYQYTTSSQETPLTKQEAGMILSQFVGAIQKHLPNAFFSLDISPWVDDNGTTNGKSWYSNFDLSKFTFINTSGGSTEAANSKIRGSNNMTWGGVAQVTGKAILADTGYGANGVSAGHDANWDSVQNLNARIDDGVISISQYNPKGDWAATIKSIRGQLKKPKHCP